MDMPTYKDLADNLRRSMDEAEAFVPERGNLFAYGYLRGALMGIIAGINADIDAAVEGMAEAERLYRQEAGDGCASDCCEAAQEECDNGHCGMDLPHEVGE